MRKLGKMVLSTLVCVVLVVSFDRFNNGMVTVQTSATWNYTFSDSSGKGILLNIDTANGLFKFMTPDRDYGIRKVTDMQIGKTIVAGSITEENADIALWIMHEDPELTLTVLAFPEKDLCAAKAEDLQTNEGYNLVRWSAPASGIGFYGLPQTEPENWRLDRDLNSVTYATQLFPRTNLLYLPIGTQTRTNTTNYRLLKSILGFAKQMGIRVILTGYFFNLSIAESNASMSDFWEFWANDLKGDQTVLMFDLLNEPWNEAHSDWKGNGTLVQIYESVIDAIRAIDPDRACGVQSYLPHEEGFGPWVRKNPVRRNNIVYVTHLYSHNWETGEWQVGNGTPWSQYYQNGFYATAKGTLIEGLYDRFGFLPQELHLPVLIPEIAFIATDEASLQYGNDVISILNSWGISWTYYCWNSKQNITRPMTLTDLNNTLRMPIVEVLLKYLGAQNRQINILDMSTAAKEFEKIV